MEDFINRIIEIDKQAKSIVVDEETLKAEADKEIAEKTAIIKAEIDKKIEDEVEKFSVETKKASEDKLGEKKKYYDKISEEFGDIYEKQSEQWVDELVKRTLA